jgi:AraC-like DNA-binding protein
VRFTTLAARPGLHVSAVSCADDHTRWSPPEVRNDYRLVLVRRGRFRRRVGGMTADVEPTVAYLGRPGEQESFAHPSGGDDCTAVHLSPDLGERLVRTTRPTLYVDARVDLAHRRLLAGAADVDYAVVEALLHLLAVPQKTSAPADVGLVGRAREALAADHPQSRDLLSLAGLLGVSPYRLSRAFTRELGVSLTRYRNRVRVGRALDRIKAGERDGATLAVDLGFADQAHLCRTVRAHVGHTPTAVRRLLAGDGEQSLAGED